MVLGINFHYELPEFQIDNAPNIKLWIEKTILEEKQKVGDLNFIFCEDEYLLEINKKYLKHDTYTDVITFDYVEEDVISGDIFISIERVIENATKAKVEFEKELFRVMIHGVLHLIGYNDKTAEEALKIRAKEDFYLILQSL